MILAKIIFIEIFLIKSIGYFHTGIFHRITITSPLEKKDA